MELVFHPAMFHKGTGEQFGLTGKLRESGDLRLDMRPLLGSSVFGLRLRRLDDPNNCGQPPAVVKRESCREALERASAPFTGPSQDILKLREEVNGLTVKSASHEACVCDRDGGWFF